MVLPMDGVQREQEQRDWHAPLRPCTFAGIIPDCRVGCCRDRCDLLPTDDACEVNAREEECSNA